MTTFKEYIIEASFEVISQKKDKKGKRLAHVVEVSSKKKPSVDEVAFKVGYHPMAYGISNSKITKLDGDKYKVEFETSTSAD